MMILITGGSGSGKSAFAEEMLLKRPDVDERYYIATMKVYDDEGRQRVQRHRAMRQNKGFLTIEQPENIQDAAQKMGGQRNAVLIECMSNLVANEMYREERCTCEEVVEKIMKGIEDLLCKTEDMIIVTNNVFEDGVLYDEDTEAYLNALSLINRMLVKKAAAVVEVVVGIPIWWKGGEEKYESN